MDWSTALIVWTACAVASYFIAVSKGAQPVTWALVGLLLGPLGVLLTIVAAKRQQETPPSG
jgi:hypothetical protein